MTTLKSALHNFTSLLIVGLSWGYALSFNNATGWAVAFSLTGIWLLSLLTLLGLRPRLNVQVQVVKHAERQYLQLTLRHRGPISVTPTLRAPALALRATGPAQWQTVTPLPRGVYAHIQVTLRQSDPLQVFVSQRQRRLATAIVVPPRLAPAVATTLFEQLAPLIHATHPVDHALAGLETQDFRPYQPGDPGNQIDWKLSAKQQTTMLRVLATDEPRPWAWVFFTTSRSDLEAHLAAFYSFVQLVSELPATIVLIGATQQQSATIMPDAFASYQPYTASETPQTPLRDHRVVLFGDDSPIARDLLAQLHQQNLQASAITWPLQGGVAHASTH